MTATSPLASQLLVRDYMVPNPATLTPDQRLLDAQLIMHTKNIRHVPVVKDGRLKGLLTDRDLRLYSPSLLNTSHGKRNEVFERTLVGMVMTKEVLTVAPETLLVDAIAMLYKKRYGCLPVVLEKTRLVGVLTVTDLLGLTLQLLRGQTPSSITVP
jgi:acetoin utilization protein AcuB